MCIVNSGTAWSGVGVEQIANLMESDRVTFNPTQGEKYPVRFYLAHPGKVSLSILDPDGILIRKIIVAKQFESGQHAVDWDGMDAKGGVVPDEVYTPMLEVEFGDKVRVQINPAETSGGEIVSGLNWVKDPTGDITFNLESPSRVLLRVGIKNGPMLKSMLYWAPKAPGKVVQRWDGFDYDKIEKIADRQDLWVLLMAYKLHRYAIITQGNQTLDYRAWKTSLEIKRGKVDISRIQSRREGVRIEKNYFYPREFEPTMTIRFSEDLTTTRHKLPILDTPVFIETNVPQEDRWVMESEMFEVVYFLDYEFQSEEEQGFLPFIWKLDPQKMSPGRHVATVQLVGYSGFVVSRSVEFFVK
jgi:hypothetical protein